MKPQLVIAGLNFVVNIVLLRKYFPVYLSYKVLPMISSRNFSISSFTIRPLFFLESIVQGDGYGSLFNLLHLDILISQPHFCFFFYSSSNISYLNSCILMLGFFILFCWPTCVFLWKYHIIFIIIALSYISISWMTISPAFIQHHSLFEASWVFVVPYDF